MLRRKIRLVACNEYQSDEDGSMTRVSTAGVYRHATVCILRLAVAIFYSSTKTVTCGTEVQKSKEVS